MASDPPEGRLGDMGIRYFPTRRRLPYKRAYEYRACFAHLKSMAVKAYDIGSRRIA